MGVVLSNRCNIGCIHCYQRKNADALLAPAEIGRDVRRELSGFYPYLSMLDLLGGEAFLSPGFSDLVDDVRAAVDRPVLRVTTNGTLLDDAWAERIVRTPFLRVTVSIDGATPATYRRLRAGAELETALAGIRRIRQWKARLGSRYPCLDSFFVIMRSNFREIPQYLRLMRDEGVEEVAMETMRITPENTARHPTLVEDEVICEPREAAELHAIVREAVGERGRGLRAIRVSGLATLLAAYGLDTSFLREDGDGLYPESDDLRPRNGGFELCPNPWTTLFVTESGDVHLCFLSEPIGNLYETPLAEIWNSPQALAKRSRMIAGRYLASKCSGPSCSWREGRRPTVPDAAERKRLLAEMSEIVRRAERLHANGEASDLPSLDAIRRLLAARRDSVSELEGLFQHLCETNGAIHRQGQEYIDRLEADLKASREERDRFRKEIAVLRNSRWFDRLLHRS